MPATAATAATQQALTVDQPKHPLYALTTYELATGRMDCRPARVTGSPRAQPPPGGHSC